MIELINFLKNLFINYLLSSSLNLTSQASGNINPIAIILKLKKTNEDESNFQKQKNPKPIYVFLIPPLTFGAF